MPTRRNDQSKWAALLRILRATAAGSARGMMYGAAVLGVAALIPGLRLPPELQAVATGIGVEAMGSIIDRVASGSKLSDDEIREKIESTIAHSGINRLPTKEEFRQTFVQLRQAFAQLREGQLSLLGQNEEISAILHRLEAVAWENQWPGSPIFSRVSVQPAQWRMNAVAKDDTKRSFQNVRACPLDMEVSLEFDATNPSRLDMRIVCFYVDMIEFTEVDITDITHGAIGGELTVRKYVCEITPQIRRYKCTPFSGGFDYIKLSSGEMESFRIDVRTTAEGIYCFKVGMEYSIGGEINCTEVHSDIKQRGFFDRTCHEVRWL